MARTCGVLFSGTGQKSCPLRPGHWKVRSLTDHSIVVEHRGLTVVLSFDADQVQISERHGGLGDPVIVYFEPNAVRVVPEEDVDELPGQLAPDEELPHIPLEIYCISIPLDSNLSL